MTDSVPPEATGYADLLYRQALAVWGEDAQVDMAEEECAEFIVASKHFSRDRNTHADLVDEVADLRIMVQQMSHVLGLPTVDRRVEKKLERLEERIEEERDA